MVSTSKPKGSIGAALNNLAAKEGCTPEKLLKANALLELLPGEWLLETKEQVTRALIIHLASSLKTPARQVTVLAALNMDRSYVDASQRPRLVRALRNLEDPQPDHAPEGSNLTISKDEYKLLADRARHSWYSGRDELAEKLPKEVRDRKNKPDGWADLLIEYHQTPQVRSSPGGRAKFKTSTDIRTVKVVHPELRLDDPLPEDYQRILDKCTPIEISTEIYALFEACAGPSADEHRHRLMATRISHTIYEAGNERCDYGKQIQRGSSSDYKPARFIWLIGHGQDAPYRPKLISSQQGAEMRRSMPMLSKVEMATTDKTLDKGFGEQAQGGARYLASDLRIGYPHEDLLERFPDILGRTTASKQEAYLDQEWSAYATEVFISDNASGVTVNYTLVGGGYWSDDSPLFVVLTPGTNVKVASLTIRVEFVGSWSPPAFYEIADGGYYTRPATFAFDDYFRHPEPCGLYGFAWSPCERTQHPTWYIPGVTARDPFV